MFAGRGTYQLAPQSLEGVVIIRGVGASVFMIPRGMEQQPLKFRIAIVLIERVECQAFENSVVVFATDGLGDLLQGI